MTWDFKGKTIATSKDFLMKYPLVEMCALANEYLKQGQAGLEEVPKMKRSGNSRIRQEYLCKPALVSMLSC